VFTAVGFSDVIVGRAFCTLTSVFANFVGSATEVARTVASPPNGRVAGAVKNPADVIVPAVVVQFTAVLDVFRTVAVNVRVSPTRFVAVVGDISTVTVWAAPTPPSPREKMRILANIVEMRVTVLLVGVDCQLALAPH